MASGMDRIVETLFDGKSTTIAKDLKLNLKRIMTDGALAWEEGYPALLALATAAGHPELQRTTREALGEVLENADEIQEAAESAAIMGQLNTYYKFRRYLRDGGTVDLDTSYGQAGLRMTALARPTLGKTRFEMLAFAVSVFNGCPDCVASHEKTLREADVPTEKIHDLARLAAVVNGLKSLREAGAQV